MFQFPGSAPLARWCTFSTPGCPIRTPADQFLFADPRSFSQLTTSFFASESLGIPHTPFLTSLFDSPMCSLLVCYLFRLPTFSTTFLLYYFSSMSMNSLSVYSCPINSRTAILSSHATSNNAISQSIRWFQNLKIWKFKLSIFPI